MFDRSATVGCLVTVAVAMVGCGTGATPGGTLSTPAVDAPPATSSPSSPPDVSRSGRTREECEAACNDHRLGRHDACGPGAGPPWPDWCADDHARWADDCRWRCEAADPPPSR